MGVIGTHDVTNDLGGLYGRVRWFPAVFIHGEEDSSVYGFQAVADIRESAVNDD